jgi:two-component system phosphate regulon sensor histidine kinase PhoR
MSLPYSPKLRLAPLWPAAIALLVAAGLALLLLPAPLAEGAALELEATTRLLEAAVPIPAAGLGAPDVALQRRVVELAAGTPYRVTLIALDGTVLADSARSFDQLRAMANHRTRPEVLGALERGVGHAVRESDTTGAETAYAARLLSRPGAAPILFRLGLPLSSLATLRRHVGGALAAAAGVAAVVVLLLSWWLTRSLFRPLSDLIAVAHRMGEGDYGARVDVPDEGELSTLGRALERIAARARRQIAAVEAERDHLRATVASMSEGVLVTDARGQARLVNPSFRELFGVAGDAPPESLLGLVRQPLLDDLIASALGSAQPVSAELELPEPAPRSLALVATPLAGGEGLVVVARDVTEAERLSAMRKDFVANVSHELKTPLSAIRGYAETLVDGALDERATALRFSERILEQCHRLGDLLDDLLTLSRLEGTEPFRTLEPVDLREVVAEAVELVAVHAASKPVELAVEPGPALVVEGDPDGLLRLAANLLENAIKYNRPGGRVTVRLARHGERAEIEVADTGIGIPASHLPRIFERFYRVDKGRAREEGGTGLGLAIVKHVAQAHRGRVEVESEPGAGSTFRVFLPLTRRDG